MKNHLVLNRGEGATMPKSMTGFAKVEMECADGRFYGEGKVFK